MKEKKSRQLNNAGSTLVMVIVISLFVGIIAALVLALTMRNFESAKLKKGSGKNFYSAESVVDEIKTNLEQYADQAAKKAYSAWLESYSFMNNAEERKALFLRVYEGEFRTLISEGFLDSTSDSYFEKMFDDSQVTWNKRPGIKSEGTDEDGNEIALNDGKVVIEGISITFQGADGLSTTITTDLGLTLEFPALKVFTSSDDLLASQYIIIADGDIRNSVAGNSTLQLWGNLYSGGEDIRISPDDAKGIVFSGSSGTDTKVQIHADKVITRESITVRGGADVSIEGNLNSVLRIDPLYRVSNIWAKDIMIKKSPAGMGGALSVKGDAFIADDLSLNADHSSFTIYGNYYGYSVNNARSGDPDRNGTPEGSSAVVVNGTNAKLDMSLAERIWISGKAFISVGDTSVLEGESLTYKALQAAYLLPGECIVNVGHNPVDAREISGEPTIDLEAYRAQKGINLEYYLNTSDPPKSYYKTVTVQYKKNGKVHSLVYYYMNFRSHDKAQEYFETYYNNNEKLSLARMTMFENGQIIVNEDALVNTGNVINYTVNGASKSLKLISGSTSYTSADIVSKESELNTKFEALVTTLDEANSGTSLSSKVTESIVRFSEVNSMDLTRYQIDGDYYYLITSNEDNYTVNRPLYSGSACAIVIATGNVTVSVDFNGLIIAGGDVEIVGGVTLTAVPEKIEFFVNQVPEVAKYFVDRSGSGSDGSVHTSDLITVDYEEWKKN